MIICLTNGNVSVNPLTWKDNDELVSSEWVNWSLDVLFKS